MVTVPLLQNNTEENMLTNTFEAFNLDPIIIESLKKMEFITPTPIQEKSIPVALAGQDVFGTAQTGTGKTAAFGIPLIEHLLKNQKDTALILTPTRELAVQVLAMIDKLHGYKIKSALLIGGESMGKQLSQLSSKPRLIVGTPGRINDHLSRNTLKLDQCSFLVLDETDRMLDMGFGVQLETIIPRLKAGRQTMMFSATMEKAIVKIAEKYLNNAEYITIGSVTTPAASVSQENIKLSEHDKYNTLVDLLEKNEGSFIVFANTKIGTHELAKRLRAQGHFADAIHGDLRQRDRDRVIKSFQRSKIRILVATDVAARGLDIPHIEFVVNYDLPLCPEDYIHRIGRTGRAGATGKAINLISDRDERKWRAISQLISPEKGKKPTPFGRSSAGGSGKRFSSNRSEGPSSKFGRGGPRRDGNSEFSKSDRPFRRDRDESSFRGDSAPRPFKRDRDDSFRGDSAAARPFKRDDSSFRGDGAPRPFKRDRDDSFRGDSAPRPFKRDDSSFRGDGAPRPFKRDEGDSAPRPFRRDRDDSFRGDSAPRPFKRAEGDSAPRPFKRDDAPFKGDRAPRPFNKDRDDKPFGFKKDSDRGFDAKKATKRRTYS